MSQKKIDWENLPIGTPLRCINPNQVLNKRKVYHYNGPSNLDPLLCIKVREVKGPGFYKSRFELYPVDYGEPEDLEEASLNTGGVADNEE